MFRVIPESRWRAAPWANGGGTTHEIVRAGRGGDEPYVARLSVATIAQPGPFSSFPGRARALWLLGGALALGEDGAPSRALATHVAHGFAGDAAVHATPAGDGAARVLNLIASPGACRVTEHTGDAPWRLVGPGLAALVVLAGDATLGLPGTKVVVPLPTRATVILAGVEELLITPQPGCRAVQFDVTAAPDVTWQLPVSFGGPS